MKPDEGLSSDMEEFEAEPSTFFVELSMLIIESREPEISSKGRVEGPHCPPVKRDQEHLHMCEKGNKKCEKAALLYQEMMKYWRNNIPLCIDVLLYPDCEHGSAVKEGKTDMAQLSGFNCLLLEQWTIQVMPRKMHDLYLSPHSLMQALRSYLYFSQLSAWLNMTRGTKPACIEYRLSAPGESDCSKFSQAPDCHTFPVTSVSKSNTVKVNVTSLPRRQEIPHVPCSLPHYKDKQTEPKTLKQRPPLLKQNERQSSEEDISLDPKQQTVKFVRSSEKEKSKKQQTRKSTLPSSKCQASFTNERISEETYSDQYERLKQTGAIPKKLKPQTNTQDKKQSAVLPPKTLELSNKDYKSAFRTPESPMVLMTQKSPGQSYFQRPSPDKGHPKPDTIPQLNMYFKSLASASSPLSPPQIESYLSEICHHRLRTKQDGSPGFSSSPVEMKARRLLQKQASPELLSPQEISIQQCQLREDVGTVSNSLNGFHKTKQTDIVHTLTDKLHTDLHISKDETQEPRTCMQQSDTCSAKNSEQSDINWKLSCSKVVHKPTGDIEANTEAKSPSKQTDWIQNSSTSGSSVENSSQTNIENGSSKHDKNGTTVQSTSEKSKQSKIHSVVDVPSYTKEENGASNGENSGVLFYIGGTESAETEPHSKSISNGTTETNTSTSDNSNKVNENLKNGNSVTGAVPNYNPGFRAQFVRSPTDGVRVPGFTGFNKSAPLLKNLMKKELTSNESEDAELLDNAGRHIPTAKERARFRRSLTSSSNLMFHARTGLPLQSSPAPVKRQLHDSFDFDSSLTDIRAIKNAMSMSTLNNDMCRDLDDDQAKILSTSAPASTNANRLLGNFEESLLNGRILPTGTVQGFTVEIGASGSFCPKHCVLPVNAFFFTLSEDNAPSPYLGHVNLDSVSKRGYHVPKKGTIQVTLFNPNKSVVKMFVVMYDLSDMPPKCQTFLRQRTVYMPVSGDTQDEPAYLRYLIHLRLASSKSGKIYLHTDIRLIFARDKFEFDPRVANYELRSFTDAPSNPKFSPKR